jgi:hypothetical protein
MTDRRHNISEDESSGQGGRWLALVSDVFSMVLIAVAASLLIDVLF